MARRYASNKQEVYGTSLIADLTQYKAQLHDIAVEFGLPQYRSIVIRRAVPSTAEDSLDGEEVLYDYLLLPPCFISRASTKYVGMYLSEDTVIQAELMLMVKNLPRTFSRQFLEVKVQAYIIDPIFDEQGKVTGGVYCRLLNVLDERALDWKLILEIKPDKEFSTTDAAAVRINADA